MVLRCVLRVPRIPSVPFAGPVTIVNVRLFPSGSEACIVTVAACWLMEQGHSCDAALDMLKTLRASTPDSYKDSPQTEEQREFVRKWRAL